jgi:hypothetical protein
VDERAATEGDAMTSPLGSAIAELQDAVTVSAITTRIRPVEPGAGDALGAGHYLAFVVVSVLDSRPLGHMGVRETTLGLSCYAATWPLAEVLYLACEGVFLDRQARLGPGRIGVYNSQVVSGGEPDRDPDTQQPLFRGVVSYPTTIAAVPM